MATSFQFPFVRIGEPDWAANLQAYLEANELVCSGESLTVIEQAEAALGLPLPAQLKEYYLHFGTTASSDYMYNLRPVSELVQLEAAGWEFVTLSFQPPALAAMVVFAESPGSDPLCFEAGTGAIYLFSHDPIRKALMFTDFSQYVLFELLETERLVGSEPLSAADTDRLAEQYLAGPGIDYSLRKMKL